MKLHIESRRILILFIMILSIASLFLPFITVMPSNTSLNYFQTAMSSTGRSASHISSVSDFVRAAQNVNGYVFCYSIAALAIGIIIILFQKHCFNKLFFINLISLIWILSIIFVLKFREGGQSVIISYGAYISSFLLMLSSIISFIMSSKEKKENKSSSKNVGIFAKYGLVVIILAICLELSTLSSVFLTQENWINLLRQVSINGIMAMGMTFVIITSGIDLSVGAMLAVSGTIVGSIVSKNADSVFLGIFTAILVTSAFGFLSGVSISFFKMPPFIVTLAMTTIARGFALVYANGRPYIISSPKYAFLGKGTIIGIPIPVISFALVTLIMYVILTKTKTGRYIFAIGGNENASRISGVNIKKIKIIVYTINGLLAGFAGTILASRISSGQPAIGVGYETDAIAAVVIGGTRMSGGVGSISGTILGVLIIGLISNGLTLLGVNSYYQQIVKGLIIFAAVLLDITSKKTSGV